MSAPIVPAASVDSACVEVMRVVPYIRKRKGKDLPYSFASESEYIRRLHEAMVENGLSICPTKMVVVSRERYLTKKQANMNHVTICVTYSLAHAPSRTSKTIETLGEAADTGDKAIPKAMTIAYKYALKEAFFIETGDDPDRYSSADMERAEDRPRRARQESIPARRMSTEELGEYFDKALRAISNARTPEEIDRFLTNSDKYDFDAQMVKRLVQASHVRRGEILRT
jgi:hypothetical protein